MVPQLREQTLALSITAPVRRTEVCRDEAQDPRQRILITHDLLSFPLQRKCVEVRVAPSVARHLMSGVVRALDEVGVVHDVDADEEECGTDAFVVEDVEELRGERAGSIVESEGNGVGLGAGGDGDTGWDGAELSP